MEAVIRTNDRTLFEALLPFLRTLHISVEEKEEKKAWKKHVRKSSDYRLKKFDPGEYRGMLSHLNLDVEKELINMRKAWKKRSF